MSSNVSCSVYNGGAYNPNECSGHGNCVNSHCVCFPIFTGSNCSINQIENSPELLRFFWIHISIFVSLFAIIFLLILLQFSLVISEGGWKKLNKATVTFYVLLFLASISRVVYLLLDPYRFRGIIGPVAESILFGLPYPCLFGIYILICLMWIKACNAIRYIKVLDYAVKNAWIAIVVVFTVEFAYDTLRGIYAVGTIRLITLAIYTFVFVVGLIILAILFLTYGQKLYRRMKNFGTTKERQSNNLEKFNVFAKTSSILAIVLIGGLVFFLALTIIYSTNMIIFLSSATFQRSFEVVFTLSVVIMFWKTFKPTHQQVSTATPNTTSQGPDSTVSKESSL
jgi:hypothetical protein